MLGIIAGAVTALIGVMVWYLKYQTRQQAKREDKYDAIQKEEREFSRGLIKNELSLLHKDSSTNARLNRKSIRLIKTLTEYLNKYFNGNSEKVNFRKKMKKDDGRKQNNG